RARGITAAARRINLTTREGRKLARKPEKWQEEGWAYYDALAPVKFGAGFMGNAMSRIRPFAGYIVDPDEPPSRSSTSPRRATRPSPPASPKPPTKNSPASAPAPTA